MMTYANVVQACCNQANNSYKNWRLKHNVNFVVLERECYMKIIVLCFSLLLVGVDQLFKKLAIEYLMDLPGKTIPIIEDVLHLSYVENRGAAFGIMQDKRAFMIIFTAVVLLAVLAFLIFNKTNNKLLFWTLGLIIGGGVGNLIDRIFNGYVVDYIDFRLINFAVFNFADCCVVVGTILLMVYIIFFESKNSKKITATEQPTKGDRKLSIVIEDHTEDKHEKPNKYITVVGEIAESNTSIKQDDSIDE